MSRKQFSGVVGNRGLKAGLENDVLGMVGFYEAVQLRVNEDESILDEEFLSKYVTRLESMASKLSPRLKTYVTRALKQSIHTDIPWLRARKYIEIYQENETQDATLLSLAKLHFNVLQKQHQMELSDISKRWNDLNIPSKLPYARDRIVEAYIWALAIYYEPHYSVGRKIFTKVVALLTVIDDTYDAYGKADELELLTEAIMRGDTSMFSELPTYAKDLCQILLDFHVEIQQEMAAEGRSFAAPYLIKSMQLPAKFYYAEYLWLKKKQYIPSMEEYKRVAFPATGIASVNVLSFAGLGNDVISKEAFEWTSSYPEMVVANILIGRFMDDIVTHEFEQQREHVPSGVECYMNEYGVDKEEACKWLNKEITMAWKVLNKGCMKPTVFPYPVLERILNFARLCDVLYKDGDSMTHSAQFMKEQITSLLIQPAVT